MTDPRLTCWLSIGSTYSYLTALRLHAVLEKEEIAAEIKPISIRQIMKSMDNIPFPPSKKAKVDYMWRDIQRRANHYKLPVPDVPAPYPLVEFDRANLVGVVMNERGKYLDYFNQTYRTWFLEARPAGSDENLYPVLKSIGETPEDVLARASQSDTAEIYQDNTAQAQATGVFGAPSFSVGSEIFWGDDRLEDAIRYITG